MKIRQIGVRVARDVHSAEHAVDTAILEVNKMIATMVESRAEAGFAAEVGQDALEAGVGSMVSLASARQGVILAHSALAQVAENQGIPIKMDGPYEQKIRPRLVQDEVA